MGSTGSSRILIGVGGWEHDVFDHCFYDTPASGSSSKKLEFYSRFFTATEIRSTFWDDTLTREDAIGWAEAIPVRRPFTFIPKLHASITHKRALQPHTVKAMRTLLDTLHDRQRLGALLIQFPYGFTNTGANRFYLAKVTDAFKGYPMHVELRHETWNVASTFDLLRSHVAAPVSADLPRVRQFAPFFPRTIGSRAYLRLHGRNEKGWLLNGHDTRYDYLYNGKEIQEVRRRVQAIPKDIERVMIIWNNTTNGRAVANALQLTSALAGGKIEIPERSLEKFPQLNDIARPLDVPPLFNGSAYREAM
jgi:uncharacterized protein YecE (DUF72 family)